VYFEKLGEVSFKYKKETVGSKEYKNGVFTFSMDGKTYLTDDDQKTNEVWETYIFTDISPGMHTFSWRYRKLNNEHTEFLEAEIEVSSSSKTKQNQRCHFQTCSIIDNKLCFFCCVVNHCERSALNSPNDLLPVQFGPQQTRFCHL